MGNQLRIAPDAPLTNKDWVTNSLTWFDRTDSKVVVTFENMHGKSYRLCLDENMVPYFQEIERTWRNR